MSTVLKLFQPCEGNCKVDVSPGENEFDTPDLDPPDSTSSSISLHKEDDSHLSFPGPYLCSHSQKLYHKEHPRDAHSLTVLMKGWITIVLWFQKVKKYPYSVLAGCSVECTDSGPENLGEWPEGRGAAQSLRRSNGREGWASEKKGKRVRGSTWEQWIRALPTVLCM